MPLDREDYEFFDRKFGQIHDRVTGVEKTVAGLDVLVRAHVSPCADVTELKAEVKKQYTLLIKVILAVSAAGGTGAAFGGKIMALIGGM
jgi:hypothetical protein